MRDTRVRVLLVDDDADSFVLVRTLLALAQDRRFELDWVDSLEDAEEALEAHAADVYLVDYRFGGQPVGLDFIRNARVRGFREPMILLTAQGDRAVDERAMQVGAADYLDKLQLETKLLERSIRHAIERTRTHEALRQSQQFLQFTVDALASSIAILDAAGTIIAVNEAWRRITVGSSFAGTCGVGDNFIHVCERAPESERAIFAPLASGIRDVIEGRREQFITEYATPRDASTPSYYIARVTRFGGCGSGRAVVACEDVSELKRAEEALRQSEEQLRQSQKLEAVGRLAGGVAHDFNNLLTAITGHTEFLLRRIERTDGLYWHVDGIKKAAGRAASLTRQLLAFSRKQVLQPRVLDLNEIVSDLERMLRRIIGEQVRFVISLAPDLGRIEADPGQIEQVILNLVLNARDAMSGSGGTLEIITRNVNLSERAARDRSLEPGVYVELAVRDTGTGMDAETQARIFEPFFTTKPQGKGTGLGLSTVHGIITQSGGSVVARSKVGAGTTFHVYLPFVEGDVVVDPTPSDSHEPARGTETVLLVEDDPLVREIARRVLQVHGYAVLEANQALEAIGICRQYGGAIHLMLTDVVMPGMSGRELAERVGSIRSEMRVLFMSGYLDDEEDSIGVSRESERFIAKPFTMDELVAKVRRILDA